MKAEKREEKQQKRAIKQIAETARAEQKKAADKVTKRIKKAEREIEKVFGGKVAEIVLDKEAAKTIERSAKQKAVDEKMKTPRRTKRVKIREKIAAEAKPAKTTTGKRPKGEKTKTAKRRAPKFEADDVLFCDECAGEFPAATMAKRGEVYLCAGCAAKR